MRTIWFLWGLIIAIAISACPGVVKGKNDSLNAKITDLRAGDLVVRVVDRNNNPIANAKVEIEQESHLFEFGTAVSTHMFGENVNPNEKTQYLKKIPQLFNATVHENALKWYDTEKVRGQVNYAYADRILEWSDRHNLKMRGHTILWAVERYNQEWLKTLSPEELRQAVEKRTKEVCSRYRGSIGEYDVNNEMLHGNFFRSRLGESIVDDVFNWCRQADPEAILYVNDYNILNGYALDRYAAQIRSLLDRGVPLGGIGIQGHIRQDITPQQIQETLDTLAQFGLPIKITEFDVVADTPEKQAEVLKNVYIVAFSHPAVAGIYMWGFWEGAHWRPKAAIFKRNFQPKLTAKVYQDLVYKQWWTTTEKTTNSQGLASDRAFFGNYQVSVSSKNRTLRKSLSFSPQQTEPIKLMLND